MNGLVRSDHLPERVENVQKDAVVPAGGDAILLSAAGGRGQEPVPDVWAVVAYRTSRSHSSGR